METSNYLVDKHWNKTPNPRLSGQPGYNTHVLIRTGLKCKLNEIWLIGSDKIYDVFLKDHLRLITFSSFRAGQTQASK